MFLASILGFLLAIGFVAFVAWRLNWKANQIAGFVKWFRDDDYRNRRR